MSQKKESQSDIKDHLNSPSSFLHTLRFPEFILKTTTSAYDNKHSYNICMFYRVAGNDFILFSVLIRRKGTISQHVADRPSQYLFKLYR
jgi:hypothetical protein